MAPSEDLVDEVEAINSIYGDGTLVLQQQDSHDFSAAVLALPRRDGGSEVDAEAGAEADADDNQRLRLRLSFPAAYPAGSAAPTVLGVQSVGEHGRPGAAAREAAQFGTLLAAVFVPGQVCLFEAVEQYVQTRQHRAGAGSDSDVDIDADVGDGVSETEHPAATRTAGRNVPAVPGSSGHPAAAAAASTGLPPPMSLSLASPPPPWTVGAELKELNSRFVARCAPVTSPAQAAAFVQHLLATDRRVRSATHNMTAWRIRQQAAPNSNFHSNATNNTANTLLVYQDCDDDGETAAGGRLLHLMQLMDLWNVMVVVTRWYGGQKLGPRRFALINQAARDAFVRAALVTDAPAPVKKKGK